MFKCALDTSELVLLTDFESLMKCVKSALGPIDDDTSAEEDTPAEDSEEPASPSDGEQLESKELTVNGLEERQSAQAGGASQVSRVQVPVEAVEETPQVD